MGYDIYIGDMKMELIGTEDDEAEYEEPFNTPHVRIIKGKKHYYKPHVEKMTHPDAPRFPNDSMSSNGNSRHPSYVTWSEFCKVTGLSYLFFDDKEGLMKEHPGFHPLNSYHIQAIDAAVKRWKWDHPNAIPGFEEFSPLRETVTIGYDHILARLLWLDWWVKWAFTHCEHAGIYNF